MFSQCSKLMKKCFRESDCFRAYSWFSCGLWMSELELFDFHGAVELGIQQWGMPYDHFRNEKRTHRICDLHYYQRLKVKTVHSARFHECITHTCSFLGSPVSGGINSATLLNSNIIGISFVFKVIMHPDKFKNYSSVIWWFLPNIIPDGFHYTINIGGSSL